MHLKKIEVYGFKSFAEKVNMEFDLGVTCVVGPNGSGKSNISDCVRWVLGEQSAKNLRGGKMEDVIFVGTDYRKSMGFAKVSLVLDNSDGSLPIEYDEVMVTRKLYRSGESEYSINGALCRLKDIHELFMDTGIGKDGYSIIGQGRVDEILSSKSEDRRAIFEEASGIVKYKVRKNEAVRKLEETNKNMARINDTINVLSEQVSSLEKQASVAKKYLELTDRLRESEVLLYIDKIRKACELRHSVNAEYEKSGKMVQDEEMLEKDMESKYKLQNDKLQSTVAKLDEIKNEYHSNESMLGDIEHSIQMDEERKRNIELNLFRLRDEVGKLDSSIQHTTKEESSYNDKLDKLKKDVGKWSEKLSQEQKKLDDITNNLTDKQKEMEELNDSYLSKLNYKTVTINNVSVAQSTLDGIVFKKKELIERKEKFEVDANAYENKMENMDVCIKKYQDLLIKKREDVLSKEKDINEVEQAREECTHKLNELTVALNSDLSKYKILKDLEDNFEGYTKSVKVILKLCREDKKFGSGVHGALIGLIDVPKMAEIAIEVALGSALQYIVTDSEEDAKRVIEYLKRNSLGRATFLPIASVNGKEFERGDKKDIQSCEGFVGFANEIVSYDKIYEGIVLSFLGKIVVVNDLQQGIDMARRFRHKFKIVTLKGEFLNIGGSITGGSVSKKEAGIIARGRQIKELEDEIQNKKSKKDELSKENEAQKICLDKSRIELVELQKEQKEYEMSMLKELSNKERLEDDVKKAKGDLLDIAKKLEDVLKEESDLRDKYEKDKKALGVVEKELDDIQVMVVNNKKKHKETLYERENVQGSIMQINIELNKVLEMEKSMNELITRETNHKMELQQSLYNKNKEICEYQREVVSIDENICKLKDKLSGESKNKESIHDRMDALCEDKKKDEQELEKIFSSMRNINKNIIALKEAFSRVESKKDKVDGEINYLKDRLWDEYELTYNNAIELNRDKMNRKVSKKEIDDIRAKIKLLGDVNVGSIEEYNKVKEHYDFLIEQREDMEKSWQNLNKVIAEITCVMKEQFITQFKLIDKNFNIVFNELFEGGRAKLILDDENDVLESGIQIQVQPPGKKLQNMMLLSGGERAFTAIALLFAIIKLRPAPFCILDEIEAALDDANVYKFAEYIKAHVDLSQFILITHRKGTMEAADTIYGVTMQEQGVSKVVSLKLDEVCENEILERVN